MTEPLQPLITPEELAAQYKVATKTVLRWARQGLLPEYEIIRTPGNHIRFRLSGSPAAAPVDPTAAG